MTGETQQDRPELTDALLEEAYYIDDVFNKGRQQGWNDKEGYDSALNAIEKDVKAMRELIFDFDAVMDDLSTQNVSKDVADYYIRRSNEMFGRASTNYRLAKACEVRYGLVNPKVDRLFDDCKERHGILQNNVLPKNSKKRA